ncbi:MAG: MFS transporter [Candidatus Sabulitectum sp.]|nr:MFS transporter [Candidatus Sabulitectum sp.]
MFFVMNNPEKIPSELRETFRISITEGVYSQVYSSLAGAGSVFLTKLLVMLGASSIQFGILAATGQIFFVLMPLGALVTRKLTLHKSATVKWAVAGRALTPLIGVFPLFLSDRISITAVLAVFAASTALLAVSANIWTGWMARMVPLRIRGRFFAKRNAVLLSFGLFVAFLLGLLVDNFNNDVASQRLVMAGLFVFAGIIGLIGLRILLKQPERPTNTDDIPALKLFKEPFKDKNFRKLCVFGGWWMLAIGIGAPFWQPFMIEVLRMGVTEMLLYGMTSTLGSILTLKYWGRLIDRYGNIAAMKLAIGIGSIIPFAWLFVTHGSIWILFVEALIAGSMWGCVGVVTANLVLAVAPKEKAQVYSGLFGAFCGAGLIITMLASGIFMPPPMLLLGLSLHPMQVLFLITAFARLSALIPLSRVKEPNAVPLNVVLGKLRMWSKVRILNLRVTLKRDKSE